MAILTEEQMIELVDKLGLIWTPDNREVTKKFFEDIISHNSIQELIQYIDNNFK